MKILVEVSARHIHLSKNDAKKLFGKDFVLQAKKRLSQPNQFQSQYKVDLIGSRKTIKNVSVLGPCRKHSQVELSITDCFNLGLKPIIRLSGNIKKTPGIILRYKNKKIVLGSGVIVPQRHWHLNKQEAKKYKVKNNQLVKVKVGGKRALVFDKIKVRVDGSYSNAIHLDTDEGNAAGINSKTKAELI